MAVWGLWMFLVSHAGGGRVCDVFTGACSHCLGVCCGVGVSVPRCVAGVPGGVAQRAWAIASPVASGDGVGLERVLDVLQVLGCRCHLRRAAAHVQRIFVLECCGMGYRSM